MYTQSVDELVEYLRELYNTWQDGNLTYEDGVRAIGVFDELDTRIMYRDEMPEEWKKW